MDMTSAVDGDEDRLPRNHTLRSEFAAACMLGARDQLVVKRSSEASNVALSHHPWTECAVDLTSGWESPQGRHDHPSLELVVGQMGA